MRLLSITKGLKFCCQAFENCNCSSGDPLFNTLGLNIELVGDLNLGSVAS